YKQAIELDPDSADEELSSRLGVSAVPSNSFDDEDEIDEGRVRMSADYSSQDFDVELERPKIRFDNVGGMHDLKEEIRLKIIYPLEHPEIYKAYGKPLGGGIMM